MKRLASVFVALGLWGQDARFDVQSRLVLVPVTVTDAKERAVLTLEPQDFAVFDNGRPQKATVDTIATGVAPIALVIAVQASGISEPVLQKVRKIGAMVQPIITGARGCAAVMAFSEKIEWLQECTNDADAVDIALQKIRHGNAKSGRMLDAAAEAIDRLRKQPKSRRVLLLISESRDRGSETELQTVIVAAQAADVAVYSATYSAFKTAFTSKTTPDTPIPKRMPKPGDENKTVSGGPPRCGPHGCPDPPLPTPEERVDLIGGIGEIARMSKVNATEELAKATGGATFAFARLKGLEDAIQRLGTELHSQYVLSFTPDDLTEGYHKLEVRVSGGALRVRARPGYWSTKSP